MPDEIGGFWIGCYAILVIALLVSYLKDYYYD